jgi:hypothetical protein
MKSEYQEKVKGYLLEMGHDITTENEEDGLFVITNTDNGLVNTMLECEGEILVIEQHVLDLKAGSNKAYKRLLQMNREVVHGAFVLNEQGDKLLFRDTLQLSNLDANELEGSLNALAMALVENTDELLSWGQH